MSSPYTPSPKSARRRIVLFSIAMNETLLPNCEICVADPEAATYRIYNSIVIGILVPVVGALGIVGNALSAVVYSRPVSSSILCRYSLSLLKRPLSSDE